jgi:hypothetical protein
MPSKKGRIKRGRYSRYKVQSDAFVVLVSNDAKVGPLRGIAMEGLMFHYVGRRESVNGSAELGIFSPNHDLCLYGVPCKIISDVKVYKTHHGPIAKRRCDVQFGKLTEEQISELKYFIAHCTTSEQ